VLDIVTLFHYEKTDIQVSIIGLPFVTCPKKSSVDHHLPISS
jgi:hypothetical protein